ncbi:site-specific integrase [Mycolicibacter virginiensis]|uniref:Site-specific integrase n=1 Tax=Mycolicibacter virginiensis TaxID=1795032 RepID=A0A9X7INF2_9MYCO|nr:tyrosine-type recombinase/integrase [Mycolicibacter virginiensis]PQM52512.1 site-specific integrase [Mycolicibacter virginiensis]
MASIQKRVRASGTTTYVVRWYTPDGEQLTKGGFRTRKEAKAFAAKADAAVASGMDFNPARGKVLFRDAAVRWLESRADLKSATHNNHAYALAPAATRRGDGKTLGIDAVFGGYPLNKITREYIQDWVNALTEVGKKSSTVRHAFFTVRMVLEQAVVDGRLSKNPADHVKLPKEHARKGGPPGVVDDPKQFLTPVQVTALVAATPWPYNTLVHTAAWAGLRAGELAGLTVGDVELPQPSLNPNAPAKPGTLRVQRAARVIGAELVYVTPKTPGSNRRVSLTPETTALLRDYLAEHPRADDPAAPLWPGMALRRPRPTGLATAAADGETVTVGGGASTPTAQAKARRQADALAALSVADAEARLVLDWTAPLRHPTFYKAVYRPAVLRANRLTPTARLSPAQSFHSLRHTYASMCIAAGIPPVAIAELMGHRDVKTTLTVYAHLINTDDHAGNMAALGALAAPKPNFIGNVVPLTG